MEEPALHQEELLYRMCKKNGTKTLLLTQPNMQRCMISENPRKFYTYDKKLEKLIYNP